MFFGKKKLNVKLDYERKIINIEGYAPYVYDIAKIINEKAKDKSLPLEVATISVSGCDGVYIKLNDGWQFSADAMEAYTKRTRRKFRKKVIVSRDVLSSEWVQKGE